MPDFYATIETEIDDLALGIRVLGAKEREIRDAHAARQTMCLQRAANDLARLTKQLEALSGSLATRTAASLRTHDNDAA